MSTSGTLSRVAAKQLETVLAADAASGATVLSVLDGSVFDSDSGGTLVLDNVTLTYTTADAEADTVTLSAALAAGYETGTPLRVVGSTGDVTVTYLGTVQPDDPDAEPILAVLEPATSLLLPEGDYPDIPVELELDGATWRLVRPVGHDIPGSPVGDITVVTTDSNGKATITHGLGVVPRSVAPYQASHTGAPMHVMTLKSEWTDSTFTVYLFDLASSPPPPFGGVQRTIGWIAVP